MNQQTWDEGKQAELVFEECARSQGWTIKKSDITTDRFEHWDYIMSHDTKGVARVDVKSIKRINRHDKLFEYDYAWIELHSVNPCNRGWLYDGDADVIAFQYPEHFILVDRRDLQCLVSDLVDFDEKVTCPTDALYKIYSRNNIDKITMIRTIDFYKIRHHIWRY